MGKFMHMVLLEFPAGKESAVEDIFNDLAALQSKVPGILSYSGGPYSSPEGFNKGFTHGFTMVFDNEANRDSYFPHPGKRCIVSMDCKSNLPNHHE